MGSGGGAPPEADGILLLEHTFLRCSGACSGSRLTEANTLAIAFHQTAKKDAFDGSVLQQAYRSFD